jgi:peptidoglycan/xylan/chitin deacetylase (PgdA/CDA1 family)
VRNVRGYIGSLLVQFERRAIQIMSLAALGLALTLVALPPFGHAPQPSAQPTLHTPKPKAKVPLVLPKPDPADAQARAVDRLARRGLAIRSGGGKRRWVALTFDDGPGPYTGQLLSELQSLNAPATFFQVGKMLQQFPGAGQLTASTPDMVIGDHTYSHASMPSLGRDGQKQEILETAALMQQKGEKAPRLFRPPYGAWDVHTRALTRQRGMAMILWNVDSEDYTRPGVAQIVKNVVSAVKPGSIVLMHDGGGDRSQTLAAVPLIVKKLRKQGYGLVTVDKLIATDPPYRKDDFGLPGQAPPAGEGAG